MKKKCPSCLKTKDIDQFSFRNKAQGLRQPKCKTCCNSYQKDWYKRNAENHKVNVRKNKRKYVNQNRRHILKHLQENPCIDCGEDNIIVLDFDHIDPSTKRKNVTTLVNEGYSLDRVISEMLLCVVRCKKCHVIRHAVENGSYRLLPTE
jgi:hypothetical protein